MYQRNGCIERCSMYHTTFTLDSEFCIFFSSACSQFDNFFFILDQKVIHESHVMDAFKIKVDAEEDPVAASHLKVSWELGDTLIFYRYKQYFELHYLSYVFIISSITTIEHFEK